MTTKIVFYSKSADKKTGKGIHEKLKEVDNFSELNKIKDWRKKLSNMSISPFILGGKKYISVENFFHTSKFMKDYPNFADTFVMNAGYPWSNDPFKAKQAGKAGRISESGKKYTNSKLPQLKQFPNVKMRQDFYEGIDKKAMTLALYSKFSQNIEDARILLLTQNAELYHLITVRGKKSELQRWDFLERVRRCIKKNFVKISKFYVDKILDNTKISCTPIPLNAPILVVKKPWINMLLDGSKNMEVRKGACHKTPGTIVYLSPSGTGVISGCIEFVKSIPISDIWDETRKQHRNPGEPPYGDKTFGWVFKNPKVLPQEVPYVVKVGSIIWRKYVPIDDTKSFTNPEIERIKKCAYSLDKIYSSLQGWSDSKKLAALLCFNDRYGSQGSIKFIKNKELKEVLKIIKSNNNKIKNILSKRTDKQRIQCQRPISGDSLLSITGPENKKYSKQLNALLVLSMDTYKGVDGYRIGVEKDKKTDQIKINKDAMSTVPFKIYKKLQPEQPSPENPKIEAKKINIFLKNIFKALKNEGRSEFQTFVKNNKEILEKLGLNSLSKFTDDMKFYTFIANAEPGKQIILWATWHATGSSKKNTAKISAFIDLVPKKLLDEESRLWYNFVCQNAPYDPGAGRARGAWTSFNVLAKKDSEYYGIPQAKNIKKWEQKSEGLSGILTEEQKNKFKTEGYLVIDIPEELQTKYSAEETVKEFEEFFGLLSDEPTFSFEKNIQDLVETGKKDNYKYFMDRIDNNDPFNPTEYNKEVRKSHNPQAGGKYIANDSGMGPGSTFLNSPTHLEFQFSQWITNLFSSFYGKDQILLRVLERFRVKMISAWTKSAHVDINGKSMISSGLAEDIDEETEKVLVLCQRRTGEKGEDLINDDIQGLLDSMGIGSNRTVQYVSPNKGADINIQFGDNEKTKKNFIKGDYSVIILNTCPFIFMDYKTIYEYLKPDGKMVISKYSPIATDIDIKVSIKRTKVLETVLTKEKSGFEIENYISKKAIVFKKSDTFFFPTSQFIEKINNSRDIITLNPKFNEKRIQLHTLKDLGNGNFVIIIHNFLSDIDRSNFITEAEKVKRVQGGKGIFVTPRTEMSYTRDGKPYVYSGVKRATTIFPEHVNSIIPEIIQKVDSQLNIKTPYTIADTGVDIMYSDKFPRGGSIGEHSDDENSEWGMVVVYSLGQKRWFKIRRKDKEGPTYNVPLTDNSLVVMYGPKFQKIYNHRIDKLGKNTKVGTRLSLNIRFLPDQGKSFPTSQFIEKVLKLAKLPKRFGKQMKARKVLEVNKNYYWKQLPAVSFEELPGFQTWMKREGLSEYNSILMNVYENPESSIGWHSDQIKNLKDNSKVISYSFALNSEDIGEKLAIFEFGTKYSTPPLHRNIESIDLYNGQKVEFNAFDDFKNKRQHRVRRTLKPRLNLTFRKVKDDNVKISEHPLDKKNNLQIINSSFKICNNKIKIKVDNQRKFEEIVFDRSKLSTDKIKIILSTDKINKTTNTNLMFTSNKFIDLFGVDKIIFHKGEVIGQGSYGTILYFYDHNLKIDIALKVEELYSITTKPAEEEISELLYNHNCNTVKVRFVSKQIVKFNFGIYKDEKLKSYYIMNKLEGDLFSLVVKNKLDIEQKVLITEEIRKQILCIYLNNNKFVYTDLKLANILYDCYDKDPYRFTIHLGDLGSVIVNKDNEYTSTYPPYEHKNKKGFFTLNEETEKLNTLSWGIGIILLSLINDRTSIKLLSLLTYNNIKFLVGGPWLQKIIKYVTKYYNGYILKAGNYLNPEPKNRSIMEISLQSKELDPEK